jgi:hypothetical protein
MPAGCASRRRTGVSSMRGTDLLSDRLAANPWRWSAASSVGRQSAADRMVKRRLVPGRDNQSASCRLPGSSQLGPCQERSHQDRIRRSHNHHRSHQMGSTVEHSIHSGVTQHKHSPSIEQGVSWESFPQDSGRDRIVDSRAAERIPPTVPGAVREALEASRGEIREVLVEPERLHRQVERGNYADHQNGSR